MLRYKRHLSSLLPACIFHMFFSCPDAFAVAQKTKSSKKSVEMNNAAVVMMNKNNYSAALAILRVVVKREPEYEIGKANLVRVLRLKAEQLLTQKEYKDALPFLEEALFWDAKDNNAQERLEQTISALQMNPKLRETRVLLANRAKARLDKKGAVAELEAAQEIKFDAETKKKIDSLRHSLGLNKPMSTVSKTIKSEINYDLYMQDLQRRIKLAWFPPKYPESKRVVVVFKVLRNGTLKDPKVIQSAGNSVADACALKALENASPFRPLPNGAPDDVDIQFTFDYNTFSPDNLQTYLQRTSAQTKSPLKMPIKVTGSDREKLELWQTELVENPHSVQTRNNIAELFSKHGEREVAIFLLEEGMNILPEYQQLKKQLEKIKERK